MATVYYNIASHPNDGHNWTSTNAHSHSMSIANFNAWAADPNNIPSNAQIDTVEFEVWAKYTSTIAMTTP